jgi:hypothetical protein
VEGFTTAGGYSCGAVRPIALRMVMECARMMAEEFPPEAASSNGQTRANAKVSARSLSAIGGVETGEDAAQFLLLGANTVQVCTGVMIHGYKLIHELKRGLEAFMDRHGFASIDEFRGHSLQYFTTHADLVARQAAAKAREQAKARGVVTGDAEWHGDRFVEQSRGLVAGE